MKVDLDLKIDGVIEEGHGFEIESEAEKKYLVVGLTRLFFQWMVKREQLRKTPDKCTDFTYGEPDDDDWEKKIQRIFGS